MSKEPMTEERIAAIKARAEAATPGPWKAGKDDFTKNIIEAAKDRGTIIVQRRDDSNMFWSSYIPIKQIFADAAFIAHAREDIPALLDEVERLRDENERQKEVISFLGDAAKGLVRDEVDRRKYDQQAVLSLKNGEN